MATVAFDPQTHTYRQDGKVIPSVTQIIQATGLIDTTWMTSESAVRGSDVHKALEYYDKGTLDVAHLNEQRPELLSYTAVWERFLNDSKFQIDPDGIECRAIAKRPPLYAGRIDRKGSVQETCRDDYATRTILDIKTGIQRPADIIQIAAYAGTDVTPETLPVCWLVYLHPDRGRGYTLRSLEIKEILDAQNTFAAALTVYNWRQSHGLNG
jgi:hypothetical protein